ncbi:MAG: SpoIIE family protein phosphatase [Peptococcaceae bacterium]|nr:SpoIIE family protein phosphatase [Peptococcaceae bacterium]
MAEWTTLRIHQGLLNTKLTWLNTVIPLILGILLARGELLGLYPFGVAYGAALLFLSSQGRVFGLIGLLLGLLTLGQPLFIVQTSVTLALLGLILPRVRRKKGEIILLALITGILSSGSSFVCSQVPAQGTLPLFWLAAQFFFAGGITVICWFALANQTALWTGKFSQEQGMAWLLLLVGVLSGLQGLPTGPVRISVVLISFFVLFIAERQGGGAAAGSGCLLGFLSGLQLERQNLYAAGIFGVVGFCTGAFRRFGRLGMGAAFLAASLLFAVFFQRDMILPQLISSVLGFLAFVIWPRPVADKDYLKPKKVPEVETMVNKVKTVAEIFQQIASGYPAAETEVSETQTNIGAVFQVLVERVCADCVTRDGCWEREFYKAYRFLNDLLIIVEENPQVKMTDLPSALKRQCGKPKEMLLGVKFIVDQELRQKAWRQQMTQNQEALSGQFQSVAQIMGHLAKELHMRHNMDQAPPSSLERRRRSLLDVGSAGFCKSGNLICGDHYVSLAFHPTQHAFVLSDGMGVGEKAGSLSALSLKLLEQLLNTGFEPDGAVQALNSILVLRSPEESFVTIDMAILDLQSDQSKMIKVGAVPSYLLHDGQVQVLASSGLPAGILNQIEVQVTTQVFDAEDTLVLVTDGVQDPLQNGSDWLTGFLPQAVFRSAQDLAEQIIVQARKLSAEQMLDDGVVLVVRKNFWHDG